MKLSKTLLSAILVGISLQTTVSCKKEKESPNAKQEAQKKEEEKAKTSDPCPACGMG